MDNDQKGVISSDMVLVFDQIEIEDDEDSPDDVRRIASRDMLMFINKVNFGAGSNTENLRIENVVVDGPIPEFEISLDG